jgi:hypothetical protein
MAYLKTLSVAYTTQRRVVGKLINYELQRAWKEVIGAYFKAISWNLPGGPEKPRNPPPQSG